MYMIGWNREAVNQNPQWYLPESEAMLHARTVSCPHRLLWLSVLPVPRAVRVHGSRDIAEHWKVLGLAFQFASHLQAMQFTQGCHGGPARSGYCVERTLNPPQAIRCSQLARFCKLTGAL